MNSTPLNQTERNWLRIALLFILLGTIYRLVRYSLQMPLWGDEIMLALNLVERDWQTLFMPLKYAQVLPAGDLVINWFFIQIFGAGELSLRAPALFSGLAGLWLVYRLARTTVGLPTAAVAVATLAASYYTARHAVEFKPYAIDLMISAGLLLLAVKVRQGTGHLGFVVLALAAPLFSYPAVFTVAGCLATLALNFSINRQSKRALGIIAVALAIALWYGLYYAMFIRSQAEGSAALFDIWADTLPPENLWQIPFWLLNQLAGKMSAYPIGSDNFGSSITLLLAITGAWMMYKKGHRSLLVLLLMPFMFTLIGSFLSFYPFGGSARVAQHLAPSIVVLVGFAIVSAGRSVSARTLPTMTWLGFCGLLILGGTAYSIAKPYKSEGDRQVRDFSRSLVHDHRCDAVYSFNTSLQVPVNFSWYLRANVNMVHARNVKQIIELDNAICMVLFSVDRFPAFNAQIERLSARLEQHSIVFDDTGSVEIYGENKHHPHRYRLVVWRRDTP